MQLKYPLVLLGLLLMVLAVSASSTINVVPQGGDVFLGEQNLNLSTLSGPTVTVLWFSPSTSNIQTASPGASRTINPASFYVSPADFGQYLGNWYTQVNSTPGPVAFVVRDPSITMSVRDTAGNDITGNSITQGTLVNFRVESNVYSAAARDPSTPFGTVKIQTPDGTIYTALASPSGTLQLTGIPISSSLVTVGSWDTGATSGNTKLYKAGSYSVWVELSNVLNSIHDNYNQPGKTSSSHVTLAIASTNLKLTSSQTSLTLGNPFSVTVTGQPNTQYSLFVKAVGGDIAPVISDNQDGVTKTGPYSANITTASSGQRTIGFQTDTTTKAKTWTIRVQDSTNVKSDEVQVQIIKGGVTITSSGTNGYYLGNEISLAGTNTQSSTVYLFITGPNLPSSGGQLNQPRSSVTQGVSDGTWTRVDVNSDNTWSYKWETANLGIDAGAYTIYAVATPDNKDNLGNTQYGTTSVSLAKPYISASIPTVIAAGDKLTVTGNAGSQNDAGLAIWVFGKNYFHYYTLSVNSDGTFSYDIPAGDTQGLASGQYAVFVQNPMQDGIFDVRPDLVNNTVIGTYPINGNVLFSISRLQTSDGAAALKAALDNPAIDDIYYQGQFIVGSPIISLPIIGQHMVGDKFVIQGTTNLAVGDSVIIEIVSSSFNPTNKSQTGQFSGVSGNATIVAGSGLNAFSYSVDTSLFKPDEYLVTASSIETNANTQTTFIVVPYVAPTPVPTTIPPTPIVTTVQPTPIMTTVNTTVPTTEATKAPGFGSLVAIAGLAAVAFLVTRK